MRGDARGRAGDRLLDHGPLSRALRRTPEGERIKWFANVTTVAEARAAEAAGADAVVAQGMEAGGHRGAFEAAKAESAMVGLFALLPAVVDAVKVPVIAAGGIADARGVARRCCSAPRPCRSALDSAQPRGAAAEGVGGRARRRRARGYPRHPRLFRARGGASRRFMPAPRAPARRCRAAELRSCGVARTEEWRRNHWNRTKREPKWRLALGRSGDWQKRGLFLGA